MKKLIEVFFIVLAFILANVFVYVFWWALTDSGNYIWDTITESRRYNVETACNIVFWISYVTWTILINLFLIAFLSFHKHKRLSISLVFMIFGVYVTSWYAFGPRIAQSYVTIFENQVVSSVFLTEPIKRGGYGAGEIILKKITDSTYTRREAAIRALGELKYEPASATLGRILLNGKESRKIRGASYLALKSIGSTLARKYLLLFSQLDLQTDKDRALIQKLEKNNEY